VRLLGWGAPGIAAANAVGICLAACCMLRGLRARMVPIDAGEVAARLGGLVLAAGLAAATGWGVAALFGPAARSPLVACGLGALLVPAVFAAVVATLRRLHRLYCLHRLTASTDVNARDIPTKARAPHES
jgi:putative peptidoglycan lipid II flippase